ncbi:pseudouridine synthase [Aridibaculum aurantiacum]|uniref:pseudouridine synthase n=1 Tax=Aridibaculum aurantiacum TaxID=2810307 RepID=UPI001F613021|nr:pseudouridine synthase [Aridibaculum aurantiacum]
MYMHYYFIIYKPFQVLSQFTSQEAKTTLADVFKVPKDVYPVGRLDYDSEGLLILSNDASLNQRLLHPKHKHEREYWVQVDGAFTLEALQKIQAGVTISIDGKQHRTLPCKAYIFTDAPLVPERDPPIRFRKNIPTSWIRITLHEGKNRQVRKMTAAVGFPTLRLIRHRIESITIDGMKPGDIKQYTQQEIMKLLF